MSDGNTRVVRLADLTPDPDDLVVLALMDTAAQINSMPAGQRKVQAVAELGRLALECGLWELGLRCLAPGYVTKPFSRAHREVFEWGYSLRDGTKGRPLVVCLGRGAGKTSALQLLMLVMAVLEIRPYVIYVGATQTAVEDKVSAVGELLMSDGVSHAFPGVAKTYSTATGAKRDWRRSRIRTASGFTLDALGMDQAIRGIKLDEDRPGCHQKGTVITVGGWTGRVEECPFGVIIEDERAEGYDVAVWGNPLVERVTTDHRYWCLTYDPKRKTYGEPGWLEAAEIERTTASGMDVHIGSPSAYRRSWLRVRSITFTDEPTVYVPIDVGAVNDHAYLTGHGLSHNCLVLDDIESTHDTPYMTNKKAMTITRDIIPALADNGTTCFIQNKISEDSIMAQMLDGRAEFLADRITVGPVPQVEGLQFTEQEPTDADPRRYVITAGTATWAGLDLKKSEEQLNELGWSAFAAEKQHDTSVIGGDMFPSEKWVRVDAADWPKFKAVCRGWDLAASERDEADYTVGVLIGIDNDLEPWILDVVRGHWSVATVETMIAGCIVSDRDLLRREVPAIIERQPGTAQKHFERAWKVVLAGMPYFYADPTGNKMERALSLSGSVHRGEARITRGGWNVPFLHEFHLFPDFSKNDDQVDAAVHAYRWAFAKAQTGGTTVSSTPAIVTRGRASQVRRGTNRNARRNPRT